MTVLGRRTRTSRRGAHFRFSLRNLVLLLLVFIKSCLAERARIEAAHRARGPLGKSQFVHTLRSVPNE